MVGNRKNVCENACYTLLCNDAKKTIKKQDELIQFINTVKRKQTANQHKINKAQQHLEDIQNYKMSGSIIRSKEKIILEQEKPNKFFFDQEKQK